MQKQCNINATAISETSVGSGTLIGGDTYSYRFAFADSAGTESLASTALTRTITPTSGNNAIDLTNLPSSAEYPTINIYRTAAGDNDFFFLDSVPQGTTSFTDDGSIPLMRITRQAGSKRFAAPSLPVISNDTVLLTREVLARVMSPEGTGRSACSTKYSIFGKSGTPQMPNTKPAPGEKGYFEDRYMPNFVAAAPLETPRIVVACGLQDPLKGAGANLDHNGHGYGGGYSAGRVARDMIDFSLEYLGVPGDLQQTALHTQP